VGSHELPAGKQLGIEVPRNNHRFAALARELRQDVFHRDGALGGLRGEGVFIDLALAGLELGKDISLQLEIRLRARWARSASDRMAGELERRSAGNPGPKGRGRKESDQEDLRAE